MAYRDAEQPVEINEPEAWRRAQEHVGYRLTREATEYRWGWVYQPAPPVAMGPGPVAVTRLGVVVAYGSTPPVEFSDENEPVDRFAPPRPWWRRLWG